MYPFIKVPVWIMVTFSLLCLFQVRCWFEEMVERVTEKARFFYWMGERFTIMPNRSFIIDKSLEAYGVPANYQQRLN